MTDKPVILERDNDGQWIPFTATEYAKAHRLIDATRQPKACPSCNRLVQLAHLQRMPVSKRSSPSASRPAPPTTPSSTRR